MTLAFLVCLATGSFPGVNLPPVPCGGAIAGDSLAVVTSPQAVIPGYCPSVRVTGEGPLVVVTADTGAVGLLRTPEGTWEPVTALGPCDTVALQLSFLSLVEWEGGPWVCGSWRRWMGGPRDVFFHQVVPQSPDSCASDVVAVTASPDSGPAHDPVLAVPSSRGGRLSLAVWDQATGNSYLFALQEGGAFWPEPSSWSSALPRPDTAVGAPSVVGWSPDGRLVACVLGEARDGVHVGLQPWVTVSDDGGASWGDLVMLPSEAEGSALEGVAGRMPYGSFRGGTSWYAPQLEFLDHWPVVVWTAWRSPADTSGPEGRVWPGARAVLCSVGSDEGWVTTYVGKAMVDSSRRYDAADWVAVARDGAGLVVLWSDLAEDGSNLDIWATAYRVRDGAWLTPICLGPTPGSEAFLEVAGPLPGGTLGVLAAEASLLYGQPSVLSFLEVSLDRVWASPPRPDIPPMPLASPRPEAVVAVTVAPNPCTGSFTLVSRGLGLVRVGVYDLAGREVGGGVLGAGTARFGPLPPGVYVVRWETRTARGGVPVVVR